MLPALRRLPKHKKNKYNRLPFIVHPVVLQLRSQLNSELVCKSPQLELRPLCIRFGGVLLRHAICAEGHVMGKRGVQGAGVRGKRRAWAPIVLMSSPQMWRIRHSAWTVVIPLASRLRICGRQRQRSRKIAGARELMRPDLLYK